MPLPARLSEALGDLAPRLASTRDPWWIVGSGAIALHGGEVEARDLDLLMTRRDAAAFLAAQGLRAAPGEASGRFRSDVFGRAAAGPLPLDVMGGFHVQTPSGWREIVPATRVPVEADGATFYVPSLKELLDLCRLFGRPKDDARARLVEAMLGSRAGAR